MTTDQRIISKIDEATRILAHYMRLAIEAAGLRWDSDNDAEMRQMVEAIVEAARLSSPDTKPTGLFELPKDVTK
jgi:hypothetical protein